MFKGCLKRLRQYLNRLRTMKPRKPGTQKLLTLDFLKLVKYFSTGFSAPPFGEGMEGGFQPVALGFKERSRVLPKTSAVLYDERKYSPPVGYGTAEYEDMPYCMEMTMRIVGKEIGAYRI